MSRKAKKGPPLSVDERQVERLAALSRLTIGPEEARRLRDELSSILDYFATLEKVDVSRSPRYEEEASVGGGLREDVVRSSAPREVFEGVPHKKGRYVRAPRVF